MKYTVYIYLMHVHIYRKEGREGGREGRRKGRKEEERKTVTISYTEK